MSDGDRAVARAAAGALRDAFNATAGGEEGLLFATGEALAGYAAENLAPSALDALEDGLVDEVQHVRGRSERDPLGLVLTPGPVASALGTLLAGRFESEVRKVRLVLDPACGTGRLLDGAVAAGLPVSRRVGWDIDPVVLTIGKGLASLRARADLDADLVLSEGDGLSRPRPAADAGELLAVCNPPFVAAYARRSQAASLDTELLSAVSRGWSSGRINTAIAFVARVVRDLLRPGELAGFVLPDALLASPRYAEFRRALLAHVDAMVVGRVPERVFAGRGVRAVLLAVRRGHRPALEIDDEQALLDEIEFRDWDGHGWGETRRLSVESVEWSPAAIIPWPTERSELAFGLARQGSRLNDVFEIADGVNPGGAEARAALVKTSTRGLSRPRPLVEGKDIEPGRVHAPNLWIETAPAAIEAEWKRGGTSLRRPELFAGPRLYSRQTSDRLVCAYVEDDSMALNSVHVIRWRGPSDVARTQLERLSAILDTRIVTEVYQALFAEDRELFPQVKIANLREMPLPWPPPAQLAEAADRWAEAPSEPRLRHVEELTERWLHDVGLPAASVPER